MFAELYLAEEAFALHLLLQHPEGLVDIGVAAIPSIRRPGYGYGRFRSRRQLWYEYRAGGTTELAVIKSSRSRRQRRS